MISEERSFDRGDLYGLQVCLRDMDEMIARSHEATTDKAVAYALIKTFELTYELATKTLRRFIAARTLKSDQAERFDFRDLIRLADQMGLVRTGWPEWNQYRADRGRTVHTYSQAIALSIASHLSDFSAEIHVLLTQMSERLEDVDG